MRTNNITRKGKRFFAPTLTAFLVLAITFIFSCSSDLEMPKPPDDTDNSSSSGGNSSSSGTTGSSSSSEAFSSSSEVLSSSSVESSSSAEALSSSSDGQGGSSSSGGNSSSGSVDVSSSSSDEGGSSSSSDLNSGTFIDTRDDKTYKWVKIGTQTWMAENLNHAAEGSKCYDDNTGGDSQGNCVIYGRLYTWTMAMAGMTSSNEIPSGKQGVCPENWHLPSDAEWDILVKYADPDADLTIVGPDQNNVAGKKLKASHTWNNNPEHVGTDDFKFSALPGGSTSFSTSGSFYSILEGGYWWSATDCFPNGMSGYACSRRMAYNFSYVFKNNNFPKSSLNYMLSVRCIKDTD